MRQDERRHGGVIRTALIPFDIHAGLINGISLADNADGRLRVYAGYIGLKISFSRYNCELYDGFEYFTMKTIVMVLEIKSESNV